MHTMLLLLLTVHIGGQLQLPWDGNIANVTTTADILIEDQLWLLLDKVIVDQEQELPNPNSSVMP